MTNYFPTCALVVILSDVWNLPLGGLDHQRPEGSLVKYVHYCPLQPMKVMVDLLTMDWVQAMPVP